MSAFADLTIIVSRVLLVKHFFLIFPGGQINNREIFRKPIEIPKFFRYNDIVEYRIGPLTG